VITSKQAAKLNIKNHTQISPYLETCCLRISASVSYERTTEEVEYLTGIRISKSAQQRLIHRQEFELLQAETPVAELSVDGGNIRVRTPKGEVCSWKGYKAAVLHQQQKIASSFQENETIVNWVNSQELAPVVTCLGDGHDGVWNIIKEFVPVGERREILDWFHLMENLHKIGGSNQRLFAARELLWYGKVDETKLFSDCSLKQAENFCAYLEKHRHRIINYCYFQAEQICSIGSGSIESTIKQIVGEASPKENRRTKISGAQWKAENVPQVLVHRCAYLNGLIRDRLAARLRSR
jgi:hypothetical protein